MARTLNGFELEEWVKDFAKKVGILNEKPFKAEQTITLFNQRLNQRLNWIRPRLSQYFIDGDKWIEQVLNQQPLTGVSSQVKNDFVNTLADLVMATDLVVKLNNSSSQTIQIAVDVTSDKKEIENKLRKIKGFPTKDMVSKANKNIPEVRATLGIDKHLILLLDRTKTLLPSHETLLNAIYAFAESPTVTKAVDLTNLEPKDRYNWRVEYEADPERMWKKYTQSFNSKPTALIGLETAKHALRENHTPKAVLNMLTYDPQYRAYLRRDGGDRTSADIHAQGILERAQAELVQARVNDANKIAQGINLVLEHYGKLQEDGRTVFEDKTLRFSSTPTEMLVQDIKSSAVTFYIKDGKLLKHNVNSDLKAKVNNFKKLILQEKPQYSDTDKYKEIALYVESNFNISPKDVDSAVYKIAQERGLDCDAIIRQSPIVLDLEGRLADVYVQRSATLAKRMVLEPKAVKTDKKIADNVQKSEKSTAQDSKLDRAKKQDRGFSR